MISRCVGGGVFWTVLRPVQGFSRIVRGLPTSDFLLHISVGLGAADVFWLCPMSCAKAVWTVGWGLRTFSWSCFLYGQPLACSVFYRAFPSQRLLDPRMVVPFEGQKYFARLLDHDHEERNATVFETAKRWLDVYFSGREPEFDVPLHLTGTAFQNDVWRILRTIPYGQTMTYGQIARRLAAQRGVPSISAQAVGGAVGHNAISIRLCPKSCVKAVRPVAGRTTSVG